MVRKKKGPKRLPKEAMMPAASLDTEGASIVLGRRRGEAKEPSNGYPLPLPECFFPRGRTHDAGVFIPGGAVSGPAFICRLTSINQAPELLEASQTVLGTIPSFSIY